MLLDFDDNHPETPRFPSPITVREGVLVSLVLHLLLVIVLLVAPESWFEPSPEQVAALEALEQKQRQQEPLRFVEVVPQRDMPAPPRIQSDASDLDRRATTRERAPSPENMAPLSRGNTPEPIVGGPKPPAAAGAPEPPSPPAPPPTDATAVPLPDADRAMTPAAKPPQQASARRPTGNLGNAFQNLEQYLRDENFENQRGGQADQSAEIQFDTMGVDFGPWLRYFKNQVERNWNVPPAIQSFRGRVIIRFGVMRNGTITGLTILQPGPIPALTQSALNALKMSNPTRRLPAEYPIEPAVITVTFLFNEPLGYAR
jgi:TonB family protein